MPHWSDVATTPDGVIIAAVVYYGTIWISRVARGGYRVGMMG